MHQIYILGEENGLNDVISQIEASARGSEINWRIAFGDLLQSLNQRNARLQGTQLDFLFSLGFLYDDMINYFAFLRAC